jgi:hypothetical protein
MQNVGWKILLAAVAGSAFWMWAEAQDEQVIAHAPSAETEERVLFNFRSQSALVYGVYSAKTHGKKSGIDAEIAARREGKQVLTDHLFALCAKSVNLDSDWKARLSPRRDWNANTLTSQGSEVFPGSALLIRLMTPLDKVFSKYPPKDIRPLSNGQSESFVFRVPPLSLKTLKCGTVMLVTEPSRKILVAPGYATPNQPNTTVIKLALGKEGLEAASPEDLNALKRANLQPPSEENTPVLLPVETSAAE